MTKEEFKNLIEQAVKSAKEDNMSDGFNSFVLGYILSAMGLTAEWYNELKKE